MTAFLLLPEHHVFQFSIGAIGAIGWWLVFTFRTRALNEEARADNAEQIACGALDAKRNAMAERDYWQGACRRSYAAKVEPALAKLSDAQVARLYRGLKNGFADELPPSDLPIGTPSNPVLTPNGDFAVYCSLADLMTEGKT